MAATAEWITPSTRPELIENLVSGVDRYNPQNVGILEDYLYHQVRSNEYDCLANLAVLKLYQFNPSLYNSDVVANILIKSLTFVPFPDFNLCIALLGERPMPAKPEGADDEDNEDANEDANGEGRREDPDPIIKLLPILTQLHTLLQECKFPAFWALYRSDELTTLRENYTVECVGFEDSIRDVVVRAVRAAFKRIGVDRLSLYLDLTADDLPEYVSKLGWTFDSAANVVTIPPNPDNHVEATVVRENIELQQLQRVISHSAKSQ